jgi:DNA-binding XRE family transcriptional regulator
MPILRERVRWERERPQNETRYSSDLTPAEKENVRAAIRFLAKRHGTYEKLAKAVGAKRKTLSSAALRGSVSAGIALRIARVAGVPLEDVLGGRWPVEGMCPHCGR